MLRPVDVVLISYARGIINNTLHRIIFIHNTLDDVYFNSCIREHFICRASAINMASMASS